MAPEVADPSKTYNKESDMWSFGMTIQKMLNLDPFEKEFHSNTSEAQMAEIASITNKNAIVDYKDFLDRHHLSLYFLVYGLLKVVPRNRFTARETKQYIHNHYVDEPSSFHCFTPNQMCNLMVELGFTYRKLVK
jgi:serine/threonine protein kinase